MLTISTTSSETTLREKFARRVAAILYGVTAIASAELAVTPEIYPYPEASFGAVLVGVAMTLTRIFVEVVKKETKTGKHLSIHDYCTVVRESMWVMAFPLVVALAILVAGATTARWVVLIDALFYLGVATVFAIGFVSSYILDKAVGRAMYRGVGWLLLSLVLVIAKKSA